MAEAFVNEKTISYGRQQYRVNRDGKWMVLMFGSFGPNDPPVGLKYKWMPIPVDKVPDKVKEAI